MIPHAAVTAAARQKAQRALLERLRDAQAVDPGRAADLKGANEAEARELQGLIEAAVVRPAGPHRYYLDEHRLADWQARQRQQARLVLLAVIVGAICMLIVAALVLLTS